MSAVVLLDNDHVGGTNEANELSAPFKYQPEPEEADPSPGFLGGLTRDSSLRWDEFGKKIINITCYAFNVRYRYAVCFKSSLRVLRVLL